jgi:hypothetical protein
MNLKSGHRTVNATGLSVAVAIAVVVALVGCAPAVHPHHPAAAGHTAPPTPAAPTPTPGTTKPALGPLPANALFRITATATEPGGATVDLVQTVFAPAAPTASDTALMNSQCNQTGSPNWQANYTSPQFVTSTITATARVGTPAWNANDQISAYFLGSASAYSGGYQVAQADCAPGYITVPGTIHGVAPVDAASAATGTYGWASQFAEYGFDGPGNDPGAADESGSGVVKDCTIEESAAAKATSGVVEGWLTQPFDLQVGCSYQGINPA